jgi:hypothetical protein
MHYLSTGVVILARVLLIFSLLRLLGVHYLLNITLLAGMVVTLSLSDRYVFTAFFSEGNS